MVVDFWAPWCGPCRVLTPALEREVAVLQGRVALVTVNVDEATELATAFAVRSIPAVKGFRDRKLVAAFEGARDAAFLQRWLGDLLPSASAGLLDKAKGALRAGDADAAEPLLAEIDPRSPEAVEIDALRIIIALIRRAPEATRGDWAAVLETLYQVVADRRPEREQALAEMRAIFDLLGADSDLVRETRRRLQIVT